MQSRMILQQMLLLLLLVLRAAAAETDQLRWLPIGPSLQLQEQQQQQQQQQPAGSSSSSGSKHWAVLVAGSSSWYNYRHQADVCHAYQLLRRNGVPADQIITMMFDDIADNSENPTPGEIINSPNGSDVYKGVRIDYRGKDVTPEKFLKILRGEGSGRVLRSGPNDHVFVNFADHGGPGLIGFPSDVLKAKPLVHALKYMSDNKMFKKLVFYLEACESGSMFQNLLPANISIYATTAANAKESSYACYYDSKRRTYLGDVYSVNWMEDSDRQSTDSETLDRQFAVVKEETNTSHVTKFGDRSLGSLPVSEFQGDSDMKPASTGSVKISDAVSQRHTRAEILKRRIASAVTEADRLRLMLQLQQLRLREQRVAQVFDDIIRQSLPGNFAEELVSRFSKERRSITNFDCHHTAVDAIHQKCFNLGQTEEALPHIYKIVNLCEAGISAMRIVLAVQHSCPTVRV